MSLQNEIPDVSMLAQLDEAALKNTLARLNYEVHNQSQPLFNERAHQIVEEYR